MINVTAVNDAPSFIKGADQTVLEDAGAQTVAGWATAISAGPADESARRSRSSYEQRTCDSSRRDRRSSATGTLTFTPAANANGSATINAQGHDNGGTANGGVDASAEQTLVINVTAVNDAPSFAKGPDPTVNEDAGAQTRGGLGDERQRRTGRRGRAALDVQLTTNTNTALFSVQPSVSATGTLTYTAAPNRVRFRDHHAHAVRQRRHRQRRRRHERAADVHDHDHSGERRADVQPRRDQRCSRTPARRRSTVGRRT